MLHDPMVLLRRTVSSCKLIGPCGLNPDSFNRGRLMMATELHELPIDDRSLERFSADESRVL